MTRIWKKFIDHSLKEFNRIYDYLNVHFESYRGESAYSDQMKDVIKMLDEKGITKVSEGAKVIDLEDEGVGFALVEKSNGSSMYITRDIATFLYRMKTYDFTKSLYVVGSEQILHFKQLFAIMKKIGVDKKYLDGAKHIPYGMVSLPTGKMSTRLRKCSKSRRPYKRMYIKNKENSR